MPKRRLTLIRHAKAGPTSVGGGGDYERALSDEGQREVVILGEHFRGTDFRPDRILSSTARRALQTAGGLASGWGQDPSTIVLTHELYLAEPVQLLGCVRESGDEVEHLVLVGHNPGLAVFWGWLTGGSVSGLPTCGAVLLEIDVEGWAGVDAGKGQLIDFVTPASLAPRVDEPQ